MKKYLLISLGVIILGLFTDPLYLFLGPVNKQINLPDQVQFNDDFLFGASSSAHQIEGNLNNDWTEWENNNKDRLAKGQSNCQKNQDQFCENKSDPNNYISRSGAKGFENYQKDIQLASELSLESYRFSIEWSRIEPAQDQFDEQALNHYKDQIKLLRESNIEPMVTLWHWTLPNWLAEKNGWCSKNAVKEFNEYTKYVMEALGQDVKYWITLNEPQVYASMPYLDGRPPGKNPICSFKILNNLIDAHKQAYKIIKEQNPEAQIGIAQAAINFETPRTNTITRLQHAFARGWNKFFLNRITKEQDFIGLNYFHGGLTYGYKKNYSEVSDLNWPLYPQGIFYVLTELKEFDKPIIITENGIADADDSQRAKYIKDILANTKAAQNEGVNIKGYLHWSLTDSFEWTHGYWPRFGLIEMDYQTGQRKIRPSAYEYKTIIENSGY